MSDLQVLVRRPRPSDQGYIASTMVDSIMRGKRTPERNWWNTIVDRLLDDAAVKVLIASQSTNTDLILGWLCYTQLSSRHVVHYVYVRDKVRGQGIAQKLYRDAFPQAASTLVYTIKGPDAERLLLRWTKAIYMPVEEFLS